MLLLYAWFSKIHYLYGSEIFKFSFIEPIILYISFTIAMYWTTGVQWSFPLQLLQKDVSKRLGSGSRGSEEIKSHKWFKLVNWKKLECRETRPSFVPDVAGKYCVANFEERWTSMPLLNSPAASPKKDDNTFNKFSYSGTPVASW